MNSDSENFDALRKLMALKRHEQPPPGYFDRLADKIAYRLEHESQPTFWERFAAGFSFRPAFAYSFALAAFGGLTFSVISTLGLRSQQSAETASGFGWRNGLSEDAMANQTASIEPMRLANWMGTTNPSASALPSLFGSSAPKSVAVSYATP
jgi:hypothetical protein